jgi:hypothetical protein
LTTLFQNILGKFHPVHNLMPNVLRLNLVMFSGLPGLLKVNIFGNFFSLQSLTDISSFFDPNNYLYGTEHYSRGHQLSSHLIVSQHFMEPQSSLPHSQELSICPYPEPDKSSPLRPELHYLNILKLLSNMCILRGPFSVAY